MKMQIKKIFLIAPVLFFCGILSSFPNVSLKNGNYFISFKDILYPGGFEPKIERVYNSKTSYHGMFGWGWGTEYEAHLTVSPDGSIVMNEYGGGASNRFVPVKFNAAQLDKAVNTLAETARTLGIPVTQEYKDKLKSDAEFRSKEWSKFLKTGKIKPIVLSDGEQLVSTAFSYQYITRAKDGYIRKFENGKIEKFDDYGRLVKVTDNNGNHIVLEYNPDGKLKSIVDNFNRKMFFVFEKGLLKKLTGENQKVALYEYNDLGELIYSKDVDGNETRYKYSTERPARHNLKEISYFEKKSGIKTLTKIDYWGKDKFENVKSVKEGDDIITEYDYVYDQPQKGQSTITVNTKDKKGQLISSSKYQYWNKPSSKVFGEPWTYKMITEIDGEKTETIYNEEFGLPVQISRNGQVTGFAYDSKGRVKEKNTPYEITKLQYDEKAGKVKRVEKLDKTTKKMTSWSEFQYDEKGNLKYAKNSEKRAVKLVYDRSGKISAMIDQDGRKLSFKYDENSKPIEIKDEKLGTITVSYNNSGEVKSVDTTAGRKIALQVTSAFQNLLDIIRPAGVNLSF